jgi:RNA 2',3'-cyclic 3'-phosphodiesterase
MFQDMFALVQQGRVVVASGADVGLFFSIFPDAWTASRIARVAQRCRCDYGLGGEPLAASRFHISLQYLGQYDEMPESVVSKARTAAACVRMGPFTVMLDRIGSFSGRVGNYPLVLRGEEGVVGLTMLYRSLGAELRKAGLKTRHDFTPHMTLFYGARRIDEQPIEPMCWRVDELVLVLSLIGQTKHVRLDQWPLRG